MLYPKRLRVFANATDGALPSGLDLTLEQLGDMFVVFGIGFSAMSGVLALHECISPLPVERGRASQGQFERQGEHEAQELGGLGRSHGGVAFLVNSRGSGRGAGGFDVRLGGVAEGPQRRIVREGEGEPGLGVDEVLVGEVGTGPAVTGLYLVQHHQPVLLVAEFAHRLRRKVEQGFSAYPAMIIEFDPEEFTRFLLDLSDRIIIEGPEARND